MNFSEFISIFIVSGTIILGSITSKAYAASNQVDKPTKIFGVTQQDLNGDGTSDMTVIDCAFATEHDQVFVYDQNGDMQIGSDWEKVTDFQDDIWVFDLGADGTAQLIVVFNQENGKYVAFVYDDMNGDGKVSYQIENGKINVTESKYWHVKVEINHPWPQSGALSDTPITFFVDGTTDTTGGGNKVIGNDGIINEKIDLGDKDGDGINDYAFSSNIIYSQAPAHKPIPYDNAIFWPLLVSKHYYENYRYFDHPPAIAMNWDTGTIDAMGILGYPIESGYHIYSRIPMEKNKVNIADFENPMAYWDMAGDQDGWPELQVRFQVAVPNDPYFPAYPFQGLVKTPNVEVDYSWDENNDNLWDYKFNVGGNYAIDEVVQFPDFSIKSIPYDEIIPWVMNKPWDVAMLVFDGAPSQDSEGMFGRGWMIDRGYLDGESVQPAGVSTQFMVGFTDKPPVDYYQDIQDYMRGEYNFHYFSTPRIYMGSVDRQLHLYSTESGVWNFGDDKRIRYQNLDGDGYIDQWQYYLGDTLISQMNQADSVLVVSGMYQVAIKLSDLPFSIFETTPPGNHDEWLKLDKQLKANTSDLVPDDFMGMLGNAPGETLKINSATLRDYRSTVDGFRFVLGLEVGYTFEGPVWLGLQGQEPGEYLVSYENGHFNLVTLTPAELTMSLDVDADETPTQYASQQVKVSLTNQGLQDANQVVVALGTTTSGGEITWSEPQTVTVLAGDTTPLSFQWAPDASGPCQLQVKAILLEPKPLSDKVIIKSQMLIIQPAQETTLVEEMSAFGVVAPWQVLLLLASVVATAGLAGWVVIRSLTREVSQLDFFINTLDEGSK